MTAWPTGPDAILQDTLRVILRDVAAEAHVGLHPWERHPEKPQRIVINVEMYAAPQRRRGKGVSSVVDYDYVRAAIRKWPRRKHTVFIESLLEELVTLCFKDKRVEACRVSIFKPDIYNEAAGAGVEIYRVRA